MAHAPRRESRLSAGINLVLGLAIFALPLALGADHAWHHWSNYTAGLIIAFLAFLTLASPHRRTQGALAGGILELALGAWVIATALAASADVVYRMGNLILGGAVALVALWSISAGARAARAYH